MTRDTIFVSGSTGYLGHEVCAELRRRGLAFEELTRAKGFDLLSSFELATRFDRLAARAPSRPVLLHLAAWSRWGDCEREPELAYRANAEASGALASVLGRYGGRMVYASTDLVFDGEHAPYSEEDEARPTSIYGRSKLQGERMASFDAQSLIVRLPLLYGPSFDGKRGASDMVISALREGRELTLFEDEWRTPLAVDEAARRLLDLAFDDDAVGIRHLPGPERLSRVELGQRVATAAGLDPSALRRGSREGLPGLARPRDCSLVDSSAESGD